MCFNFFFYCCNWYSCPRANSNLRFLRTDNRNQHDLIVMTKARCWKQASLSLKRTSPSSRNSNDIQLDGRTPCTTSLVTHRVSAINGGPEGLWQCFSAGIGMETVNRIRFSDHITEGLYFKAVEIGNRNYARKRCDLKAHKLLMAAVI